MKQIQLEASAREKSKKSMVKAERREKRIPGVMYGKGEISVPLSVSARDIQQAIHTSAGTNVLIKLSIQGGEQPRQETVMVKSIQRHPVNSGVLHIDFVKISMDQPLETSVHVEVVGTAPGIKEGGVLEQVHREIALRCLPALIPDHLTVDVSSLKIGDAITVAQLSVEEGIEILVDSHEPVVHVVAPRQEEAAKPAVAAAAAPEEAKQPEVIGEKEREARRVEKEKDKKE